MFLQKIKMAQKIAFMRNWNILFISFPDVHMKIGDFNARVEQEDIFKLTIGKESLHKISNDNGIRLVNFAISNDLNIKSRTFPHFSRWDM